MKRAPAPWLAAIVGASFLVRMVVGWLRATPTLFPDEYIYATLGRSVSESGRPLIRGGSVHFPALLQPLVTAPVWLIHDVGLAYRVIQGIEALAMSLAAIPVYVLARRLGLSKRTGLGLAALAVLVPDLVYTSFVSSESIAYPLVLAAAAAAVSALSRPTRRAQLAFVAITGLAVLARVQFAVLPLVFLAGTLTVGVGERRTRAALREQRLPLLLFTLLLGTFLAAGPAHALGQYRAVLGFHPDPGALIRWIGWDAMALAYASGWIIVPGALLGLGFALVRPRTREELAFGGTAAALAIALLIEAGTVQSSLVGTDSIQERYVFYLVPLGGIAFALYARRGWPARLWHLALAAGLLLISVRVPLSGFTSATTVSASPILYGVYWLAEEVGSPGTASLAVAILVAVLSALAVAGSRRPRLGTPLALALALAVTATASAGAVAYTVKTTSTARHAYLPADPSFVDRSGLRDVTLLQGAGNSRSASFQLLFWNRSVARILLLPDAAPIDAFGNNRVVIGDNGSLLVRGAPLRGPLLVDGFGSFVQLRGARLVARGPVSALWAPAGEPRLKLYVVGRSYDGWLADAGAIDLWPETKGGALSGWLSTRLSAPRHVGPMTLRFELPRGEHVAVRVRPGEPQRLNIAVCGTGSWHATYRSSVRVFVGLRPVSVKATAPVFSPSASACPAPEPVA